jgi:hypothetical protein
LNLLNPMAQWVPAVAWLSMGAIRQQPPHGEYSQQADGGNAYEDPLALSEKPALPSLT